MDEALVRSLLADQHPDLADLPLAALDAGWDNVSWRLGSGHVVRLPRRAAAAPLAVKEQRWLPQLAPQLPLPVPVPVRVGRPGTGYPWPWSVVPWLDGTSADRATLGSPADVAERLGRFLRALHTAASPGAPRNPFRDVPLVDRADAFTTRADLLAGQADVARLRPVWDRGCCAPAWPGPPVWIHGDLHPANILVGAGTVVAVVDWGDLCAGDPATDLAGGWLLLPEAALPVLVDAYGGVDGATWARARGWAVLFGLMLLTIGLEGSATYEAVARSALDRLARSTG